MAWKADPPEAVVFDAFGTLVTAVPGKDGAYQTLARDVAAEPVGFRRSALTCPASLHEFAFSLGASDPAKYQRMLESELEGCALYDDVSDTLAFLRATGVRYAVCSNLASGYGGKVRELVPGAEAYVFSYETGLVKPESGIYGACCEALGLPPEKIAFIGDTPRMDFQLPDGSRDAGRPRNAEGRRRPPRRHLPTAPNPYSPCFLARTWRILILRTGEHAMSDEIETLDLGNGRTAEIVQDSDCSQPFEDDDAVHIVVLSRRYRDPSNGACGRTPDEIEAWEKANPDWFTTPLWFFEHSGIAYAAGASNPFSCPWDSGQAGIVALKRSEWGNGNPTDEQLAEYANNVAQEFGQWANGETYGYIVRDSDGNEKDSCFGFVGLDRVKEEVMNEHGPQSMAPAA